MAETTQRTAVVFDPHPLWLDGVRHVLDRVGVRQQVEVDAREGPYAGVVAVFPVRPEVQPERVALEKAA